MGIDNPQPGSKLSHFAVVGFLISLDASHRISSIAVLRLVALPTRCFFHATDVERNADMELAQFKFVSYIMTVIITETKYRRQFPGYHSFLPASSLVEVESTRVPEVRIVIRIAMKHDIVGRRERTHGRGYYAFGRM